MLTYEEFERYMLSIKAYRNFDKGVMKVCEQYTEDTKIQGLTYDECTIFVPNDIVFSCIDLLEKAMGNVFETINYYVFEMDFGESFNVINEIKSEDEVEINSLHDLYDLLVKEAEEKDNPELTYYVHCK